MSSEDDWSVVGSDDDWEKASAQSCEDEVEQMVVEAPAIASLSQPSKRQEIDVLSLLADTSAPRRPPTRSSSLSLLTQEHQQWLSSSLSTNDSFTLSRKRSMPRTCWAEERPTSFPARLRAAIPSQDTALPTAEDCQPIFTPVVPLAFEVGTQTDDCSPADPHDDRMVRLGSALERNLALSRRLHEKAQQCESLDLQLTRATLLASGSQLQNQKQERRLRFFQRRLDLAQGHERLASQYQDQMKQELIAAKLTCDSLQSQIGLMNGQASADGLSLQELEALETSMETGLSSIRKALRAKYRESMARKQQEELCIVCFAQPISVVLLPCRHQVLCSTCALRVTTCPIDRQDISEKVLTFGLRAYTHTTTEP